jgi:hypothetical protein
VSEGLVAGLFGVAGVAGVLGLLAGLLDVVLHELVKVSWRADGSGVEEVLK